MFFLTFLNSIDSTYKLPVKSTYSPFSLLVPHFWTLPPLSATSFFPISPDIPVQLSCHYPKQIWWFYSGLSGASKGNSDSLMGPQVPFISLIAFPRFVSYHLLNCVSCLGYAERVTAPRKGHDHLKPEIPSSLLTLANSHWSFKTSSNIILSVKPLLNLQKPGLEPWMNLLPPLTISQLVCWFKTSMYQYFSINRFLCVTFKL